MLFYLLHFITSTLSNQIQKDYEYTNIGQGSTFYVNSNNRSLPCIMVQDKFYPKIEAKVLFSQSEDLISFFQNEIRTAFKLHSVFSECEIEYILQTLEKTHPDHIPMLFNYVDLFTIYEENERWYKKGLVFMHYHARNMFSNKNQISSFDCKYTYQILVIYHNIFKLAKYGCSYLLEYMELSDGRKMYQSINLADETPIEILVNKEEIINWIMNHPKKVLEQGIIPIELLSKHYCIFFDAYRTLLEDSLYENLWDTISQKQKEVFTRIKNYINHLKCNEFINVGNKIVPVLWKQQSQKFGIITKTTVYQNPSQLAETAKQLGIVGEIIGCYLRLGVSVANAINFWHNGLSIRTYIYFDVLKRIERIIDLISPEIPFSQKFVIGIKSFLSDIIHKSEPYDNKKNNEVMKFLKGFKGLYVVKSEVDSNKRIAIEQIYLFPDESFGALKWKKIKNKFNNSKKKQKSEPIGLQLE